jgi:hypothetical protein
MMKTVRAAGVLIVLAGLGALAACVGQAPNAGLLPPPAPPTGGLGVTVPLNQHVTFVVSVPPPPSPQPQRVGGRPSPHAASSSAPSGPYISPKIGSLTIQLVALDGQPFAQVQPTLSVDVSPSTCPPQPGGGCVLTIANVAAASGTDRYLVRTFSAAGGQGNLISSGLVDVTVPNPGSAALGGTARLSIGGFVAGIVLSPQTASLTAGKPATIPLLVEAVDPAGAIIIGNVLFATPITVTTSDTTAFALAGSGTAVIPQPLASPLPLTYNGHASAGTVVNASSIDENGHPVQATPLKVSVVLPPSPSPSPSPSVRPTRPPRSLYVIDAANDRILEYDIPTILAAGGQPGPSPTPRRVIEFVPPATVSCAAPSYNVPDMQALAIDAQANLFVPANCNDGTHQLILQFAPTAVGTATPSATYPILGLGAFGATFDGATQDAARNRIVLQEWMSPQATFGGNGDNPLLIQTLVPPNQATGNLIIGDQCIVEYGFSATSCVNGYSSSGPPNGTFEAGGAGYDASGFGYLGVGFEPNLASPNPLATYSSAVGVAALTTSVSNPVPVPYSVLAGPATELGWGGGFGQPYPPLALFSDGTLLYVLAADAQFNNYVYGSTTELGTAGLAGCAPASAHAKVDQPSVTCADGFSHLYVAAYSVAALQSVAAQGTVVNVAPTFLLGADAGLSVTRMGCNLNAGFSSLGQFLAADAGYLYVSNPSGPNCSVANTGSPPFLGEIDVYNVGGLSSFTTALAPVVVLHVPTVSPWAIAIGPSGTATGGQPLLRRVSRRFAGGHPRARIHPPLMRFKP